VITNAANGKSSSAQDLWSAGFWGGVGGIIGGPTTRTFGFNFTGDIGSMLRPVNVARSIAGNTASNIDLPNFGKACPCN
jgi:hypothetical protein